MKIGSFSSNFLALLYETALCVVLAANVATSQNELDPDYNIDVLSTLPSNVLNISSTFNQRDRSALFAYAIGAAEQLAKGAGKDVAETESGSSSKKKHLPSKCFRGSSRALLKALYLTWPDDFGFTSSSTRNYMDNEFLLVEKQVTQAASFVRRFRRLQADMKGNGGLLQNPSNTIVVDASLINAVESAITTMMRSEHSALIDAARLCFVLPRFLTTFGSTVSTTTSKPRSLASTTPAELIPTAEEHLDYDYYRDVPKSSVLIQPSATTSTGEDDIEEIILQTDNNFPPPYVEPPDNATDARELVFCPLTVRRRARLAHTQPNSERLQQQPLLHVHRQDISNPAALSGARPTPSLDDHGEADTSNQASVELSAYNAIIALLKDVKDQLPTGRHIVHNGTWTVPYLDCHQLAISFVVRTAVNWRTSAGQDLWPFLIADVDMGRNLQRIINPCGGTIRRASLTPFDSLNKCPPAISTCVTKRDYDSFEFNDVDQTTNEDGSNLSIDNDDATGNSSNHGDSRSTRRHRDNMVIVKNSLEQHRRPHRFSSSSFANSGSTSFNDILAEYSCICGSSIAWSGGGATLLPRHNKSSSPLPSDSKGDEVADNNDAGSISTPYRIVSGHAAEQAWFKHIALNQSDDYIALFKGCHFAPVICPTSSYFAVDMERQNASQIDCISRQRLAALFAHVQHEQAQPKSLLWRGIPLGLQSFCLTCTIFLIFIVARYRQQKEMKISKWRLLLTMLTGACLLYGNVICQYFMPNERRWLCIADAWLREIGFVAFYGSIYLQIYWYYTQIQTRSAHLRLQLNERELLKLLAIMLAVAAMYLACWTSLYMQLGRLDFGAEEDARPALSWCSLPRGDNIAWTCELLFALWTLYYAYKVRHVRSAKPFALALVLEVFVSAATMAGVYMLNSNVVGQVHSNIIFAIMFARCQLTVTVIVVLVMAPRIWRMHKPDPHLAQVRRSSAQTAGSASANSTANAAAERQRLSSTDLVNDRHHPHNKNNAAGQQRYVHMVGNDMNRLSDGNLIVSGEELASLPISEMDPEDIRAELKRVYTQMQMLRNKAMRKDNPHISKKRGGKRVGGPRRFSLQALNLRLHRDSSDANSSTSNHHGHTSSVGQLSHLQQLLGPPNALTDATSSSRTPDKSGTAGDRRNSQEPQHAMPTLWEEADREEEN